MLAFCIVSFAELYVDTNVSEDQSASIFSAEYHAVTSVYRNAVVFSFKLSLLLSNFNQNLNVSTYFTELYTTSDFVNIRSVFLKF